MLLSYAQGGQSLRMLLTGDAELDQEREFVQEVGDIDVLKLGHHGSKVSVDTDLLGMLKPEFSIASAGEGNRYGHPSERVTKTLEDAGAEVYRSDLCGAVRITIRKGTLHLWQKLKMSDQSECT